jgi:hypothetical protein
MGIARTFGAGVFAQKNQRTETDTPDLADGKGIAAIVQATAHWETHLENLSW